LSVIEEIKNNIRKREKIHCHLRNGDFAAVYRQRDDARRIFVAMRSTEEQYSLILVAFASAAEICVCRSCEI